MRGVLLCQLDRSDVRGYIARVRRAGKPWRGTARVLAGVSPCSTGTACAVVHGRGHPEPGNAEEGTKQEQGSSAGSCLPAGMIPILSERLESCMMFRHLLQICNIPLDIQRACSQPWHKCCGHMLWDAWNAIGLRLGMLLQGQC